MQVNKTELGKLLGIKNLRRLTTEDIERRLLKQCWKLLKIEKQGRSVMYTLEYQERDFDIKNYVEEEFNVKKGGKFVEHTGERVKSIKEDRPMSPESIGKKIGVPKQTCVDWDDKLEKKGVISKTQDEFLYYFKYKDGKCVQVDKNIYENYCKINKVILSEMQDLYKRREKREISQGYFEVNYDALKDKLKDGIRGYKLCKYELDENNPCYQVMKDFLKL